MYNILHNIVDLTLPDFNRRITTEGISLKTSVPSMRINQYWHSFYPRFTIKVWNTLKPTTVCSPLVTVIDFNSLLINELLVEQAFLY